MAKKKKTKEDTSKSAEEQYAESIVSADEGEEPTFELAEEKADASPSEEETEQETTEPQPTMSENPEENETSAEVTITEPNQE